MSSVTTNEFKEEQPASLQESATTTAPSSTTTKPATTATTTTTTTTEEVPSVKNCPVFNYQVFKQDLPPKVRSLIYYDNPIHSGIAVGAITLVYLIFAFDLICFDLLWLSLYVAQWVLFALLSIRLAHQLYGKYLAGGVPQNNIVREKLEPYLTNLSARYEAKLPTQEQIGHYIKEGLHHIQLTRIQARRLFLCDSICVSTTGLVVLFVAQHLVSWFSLPTLAFLGVLALFTLPKAYDTNQAKVDEALSKVFGKCCAAAPASSNTTTKVSQKAKKAE